MHFSIIENNYGGHLPQSRNKRGILDPVIDKTLGTVQRDSINIQKNCGPDNICIPDLRLSVETLENYILGSKELIVFNVIISNAGEDAFEAGFYMTIPPELNFRKIERIGDVRDTPITCTAPSAATNNTLKCDIGNPLPRGKVAKFKVILWPTQKQGLAPLYNFYLEANSTNPENEGTNFDNYVKRDLRVTVESNLAVKGVSVDEEILYNSTDYVALENATNENEIGPQVVHIYEIRNNGPSTIEEAEVFFLWPYKTIDGDALLYLLNHPETTKNVRCEASQFVNERNVQLDKAQMARSFLVSQGAIERSSLDSNSRFSFSSSSASAGHASGGAVLSEEERKRIDEEENRESAGDASYIHSQRANQAAKEHGGSGSGYQHSSSSSWSSSSKDDGAPITYSASKNRTVFRDGGGNVQISEHSTENYGAATQQGGFRQLHEYPVEGHVHTDISGQQAHSVAAAAVGGAGGAGSASGRRRMMSTQDGEAIIGGNADKINYGSGGFRAGTLDLGRNNVDDDLRQYGSGSGRNSHGSSSHSGSSGLQQSGSSGSYQSGATGSQQSASSGSYQSGSAASNFGKASHGGSQYPQQYQPQFEQEYNGNDDYNEEPQDNYVSPTPTQPQRHYPNNQGIRHYNRFRRDLPRLDDNELKNRLACNNSQCTTIRCVATNLETDSSAWIALRMRIVTQTVKLIASNAPLNLSTMAVARVTRLPYIGETRDNPLQVHEVKIRAVPIPEPKPDIVPLWLIILAACIGVLILLLLIYLLYKVKFGDHLFFPN